MTEPFPPSGLRDTREHVRILVPDADTGARLDKLLVQNVPGLDRAGAKRLFAERRVRLVPAGSPAGHGRTAKGSDVAGRGDALELELEESVLGAGAAPDPDAPLQVLLVTPHVVVLDKPAGQHTAPLAPGERGTLANALVARYPETATAGTGHACVSADHACLSAGRACVSDGRACVSDGRACVSDGRA